MSESAEPTPATAEKSPFRVKGIYVAEFAKRSANRVRNIALAFAVGGLVGALWSTRVLMGEDLAHSEDLIFHAGVPIAVLIGGAVMAHRHFTRSRRLQAIAEAAQADPMAVWALKGTWLYPLDPKATRATLSVTLDAREHHDIYTKPQAPITEPAEPLP